MAKLSTDLSTRVLHPRETLFAEAVLASANADIQLDCDGAAQVAVDLRGTFSGTFEVAGSIDGTNWTLIPVRPVNAASVIYVAAITGTAQGVWVGSCMAFRKVRIRCTAYTSGNAMTTLTASNSQLDQTTNGMVTTSLVTATGASGAAVTLTLPSAGAGLRHYLTYLSINRFAAAALTAAATPVLVTTTNLPNALVFSLPAEAAGQGTSFPIREDFAFPLASSAMATATTIVAPATTGVIWRLTAGYYIAP